MKQFFPLQRFAIKFCFKLRHSAAKTYKTSVDLRGQHFVKGQRFFGGLRHLQEEESRLKTNQESEGPQLQKPIKISTGSGNLCHQIVDLQSKCSGKS